ncbi:aldo/keto reductase [Capillimicrobium parvum]|uniref:1-deoxyxylulose-5-phosphate synthase YajO n=1 Tax=Capillimicrobium parvum TaxID=2884022 RepID=A0A9E7C3F1_9ACTN|nr:aldo/keto reductase [Capillimicrobium parvum]UGS38594.1 1-deoxyxylulose-5-phosphate synthase YajO [Capillimicrobium parvum]
MTKLGASDLDVFPLCLGGNVFGWTADRDQSFAVLDAFAAAGGNFIDTADTYSAWVPGNTGGESEAIIGEWMAARGNRERIVVATKAGKDQPLTAANVRAKAEASLERLRSDHIDVYYIHYDDPNTPLEETLGTFDALVREGKVRHVAASNFSAPRLAEALAVSDREGFARFVALQPEYSLVERGYERELRDVVAREGLGCLPYWSLAMGFLTGKYRPGAPEGSSPRAQGAAKYLDERGIAVLGALDEVAAAHDTTVAAVALAWLLAQPTVTAPIASARTTEQLADLLPLAGLELAAGEVERLTAASEPAGAAAS